MRPDIAFGESPGRVNQFAGNQAAHRQVNLSSLVVRGRLPALTGAVITSLPQMGLWALVVPGSGLLCVHGRMPSDFPPQGGILNW